MMKLSTTPSSWHQVPRSRPIKLAGAAVLLLVVALGALVQSGVLAPVFWRSGTGGGSGYSFETINNGSWSAWTVTAGFADGRNIETLPSIGTVRVSLFASRQQAAQGSDPMDELNVGAGGQFGFGVTLERRSCIVSVISSGQVMTELNVGVPVLLSVSTPLGTKTVPEMLSVQCDRINTSGR